MSIMAQLNFFAPKKIPQLKLTPLAVGFVGYIVLCNVSLNLNSIGFYQVCDHAHLVLARSKSASPTALVHAYAYLPHVLSTQFCMYASWDFESGHQRALVG
jgi:hypothetical protein